MFNYLHSRSAKLLVRNLSNPAQGYLFTGSSVDLMHQTALDFLASLYQGAKADQKIIQQINSAIFQGLLILTPDESGSIKLGSVKEITSRLNLKVSINEPYRMVLIEQASSLTAEAANSLLKILEEPPPAVIFILTAQNESQLPTTIVSRLQHIDVMPAVKNVLESSQFDEDIEIFNKQNLTDKFFVIYKHNKTQKLVDFLESYTVHMHQRARTEPTIYKLLESTLRAEKLIKQNVNARLVLESLALEMSS